MEYYNYGSDYSSYNSVSDMSDGLGTIAALGGVFWVVTMALCVLLIVSMWKIFVKAGKPGWAAIVPYYNYYVMCEIAGKPWWYIFLFFVPFANIYAMFVIFKGIANKLGKSTGFTIGMILLPFIFWPILAFEKTEVAQNNDAVSNDQVMENVNDINQNVQPTFDSINTPTGPVVNNEFNTASEPVMSEPVMSVNQFETVQPSFDNVNTSTGAVINNEFNAASEPVMSEPVMSVNQFETVQPSFDNVNTPTDAVVNNEFNTISEPVNDINQNIQQVFDNMNVQADATVNNSLESAPAVNESVTNNMSNVDQNTSFWSNQNNNTNNSQM